MTQMAKIIRFKMLLHKFCGKNKIQCRFYKTENYWISFFDCWLVM